MSIWTPAGFFLATTAFLLAFHAGIAETKRGCKTFGHSCYGGMGKRASELIGTEDETLQNVQNIEENPEFIFTGPRSEYKSHLRNLSPQQYDNLSQFMRQLFRSYRTAQELQNDNI